MQQLLALEQLKAQPLNIFHKELANFFQSQAYSDEVKSILLIILNEQKLDYCFLVKKKLYEAEINPSSLDLTLYDNMFHE